MAGSTRPQKQVEVRRHPAGTELHSRSVQSKLQSAANSGPVCAWIQPKTLRLSWHPMGESGFQFAFIMAPTEICRCSSDKFTAQILRTYRSHKTRFSATSRSSNIKLTRYQRVPTGASEEL